MAADPRRLSPAAAWVPRGALTLYVTLLPYVVVTRWRAPEASHPALDRIALATLAGLWIGFVVQVGRNAVRLRRGRPVGSGASAWLAGLVVGVVALVASPAHGPSAGPPPAAVSTAAPSPRAPSPRVPVVSALGAVPLALAAKRRGDTLRDEGVDGLDVEESIALLRARDPETVRRVAARCDRGRDGVIVVPAGPLDAGPDEPLFPLVACVLGEGPGGVRVAFAREGGRLALAPSWAVEDTLAHVVSLGPERLVVARREDELLHALATRALRRAVVLYLGDATRLDDDLLASAVTLEHRVGGVVDDPDPGPGPRVELLRAEPRVTGLVEPFVETLRRRCVEMTAYLALHRHEPITGERLRTRVLGRADADASTRTLANTASAVRRSLGGDARGPRLHPVTSAGLYVTHGIGSDLEEFTGLVAVARDAVATESAALAQRALRLVQGEPLASALRGFEWFLAEGHGGRLARDGEWAALALCHHAMGRGEYERAFWALEQGLLVDPYSDALREALATVPRLREFGRDGARRAQDRAVGPRDAVAMSWALARLRHQVTQ